MTPETIGGIIGGAFVVLNVGGFWFREWRKHRTWTKNGDDLKEIKGQIKTVDGKIDCVDKKVGETKLAVAETKVAVDAQKSKCSETVTRFDKAISDQGKEIIRLAGRKR